MTKSKYTFGTFNERLKHCCEVFEIAPPRIEYEDGEPLLTDDLMDWIKTNGISMDWLFCGDAGGLLRTWTRQAQSGNELLEAYSQFEPEVREGLHAMLKAVLQHSLPIEEALATFGSVVAEWRAEKAA